MIFQVGKNTNTINELCQVIDCEHKTAPYVESSEYLVVRTSNVRDGILLLEDIKYTTKEGFEEWTQRAVPEHGDVLFTREAPAGESCLVPRELKICMGQRMVLLRPNKSKINPIFLSQYLTTERAKREIYRYSIGSTVTRINMADIYKIKVSLPTLDIQQKIASFLGAVDAKLEAMRRKRELLAEYKRGVMQKLFSQEIRFRQGDGRPFPNWEDRELGEVLSYEQPTRYLVSSTEYNDSYQTPVLTAGKTFILGYTDERDGIFEQSLPAIIFDDFTTASKFVDFPFKAKSSAMKILTKTDDKTQIKLVFEFMQLLNFSVGSHKRHWISVFQYLAIPFPSSEEQRKIANFLTAFDKKIDAVDSKSKK